MNAQFSSEETDLAPAPDRSSKVKVNEWAIEVVGGPDKGKRAATLESLIRVGSDSANDLVLTDSTVSRRHLEVERTLEGLLLKDLGSRNGSWVDGRQVLSAFVKPGDKVMLGKTKLAIRRESKATSVEVADGEAMGDLTGRSEAMRTVFASLRKLAAEDVSLLIEGETGTGKEVAARAVHQHSARRHAPFRIVDCNLLNEKTAERELFGHSRGVVPGDESTASGLFELASGGTLFLDEVAEIPFALQPKLLRVLESQEVRRVGEARGRTVDVRVIASTQRNLDEEVQQGRFRLDLYHRIAVAKVRLPPLRTRKEDIPLLARALLKKAGIDFELTPQTLSLFEGYDWPGNVRELRNVLERGALMEQTGGHANWLEFLAESPKRSGGAQKSVGALVTGLLYHEAKDRVLADFERFYFAEVMKKANFDIKEAEQRTGLSMQSLYRLLKKNGLRLKSLKNAEGNDEE